VNVAVCRTSLRKCSIYRRQDVNRWISTLYFGFYLARTVPYRHLISIIITIIMCVSRAVCVVGRYSRGADAGTIRTRTDVFTQYTSRDMLAHAVAFLSPSSFGNVKETRLQPLYCAVVCATVLRVTRDVSVCDRRRRRRRHRALSGFGVTGTAGGAVQVVGVLFGRPAGHPLARQPARRRVRPLVLSHRALETQSGHVRRNERRNEIVISPLPRPARKAPRRRRRRCLGGVRAHTD